MKRFFLSWLFAIGISYAQDEVSLSSAFGAGEGVNGEVLATAVQLDGKILIGGRFTAINGIVRDNIARLNPDGTLDRDFAEKEGVNGPVSALVIQPDGNILVGGTFTRAGDAETSNLARYLANGHVDKSFGGPGSPERGANGSVYAIAVQSDGKIIVGGNFSAIMGQPRRGIARLKADGTLDSLAEFENALSGTVRTIALGVDASFIAAGQFTLPTQSARNVLRVQAP